MSDDPRMPEEPSPIRVRPFVIGAALFLILLLAVFAVAWGLTDFWSQRPMPAVPITAPQADPRWSKTTPQLQADPAAEGASLRVAQEERLQECRWTDSSHAFVQIPIAQAMALLARKAGQGRLRDVLPQPVIQTTEELHQGQAAQSSPGVPTATTSSAP